MAISKSEALDLLAANRVQELCDALQSQLSRMSPLNELALLEGQWNALADYARSGAMSFEQVALEQAKIRARLADFLEKLDREKGFAAAAAASRKRLFAGVFLGFLAVVAVAFSAAQFLKKGDEKVEKTADSTQKSSKTDQKAAEPPSSSDGEKLNSRRVLGIKSHAFRLRAEYVGEAYFRFAQAVLSPFNSEQNELQVLFHVQPENGRSLAFQPGAFSLKHAEKSVASQSVEPIFIEAGASRAVKVRFLAPADWPEADLVVQHGIQGSAATETIRIDFKN